MQSLSRGAEILSETTGWQPGRPLSSAAAGRGPREIAGLHPPRFAGGARGVRISRGGEGGSWHAGAPHRHCLNATTPEPCQARRAKRGLTRFVPGGCPSAGINRHGARNEGVRHRRASDPRWPRVMRRRPRGCWRSVDRASSMRENRESPPSPAPRSGAGRSGKAEAVARDERRWAVRQLRSTCEARAPMKGWTTSR